MQVSTAALAAVWLASLWLRVVGKETCVSDFVEPLVVSGNESIVCDFGCFDSEDDACHTGVSATQCAEIYGHVSWIQRCNCRKEDGTFVQEASASVEVAEVNHFSTTAFVVLFRESLEVVIVLVIIVQFLTKAKEEGTLSEEMYQRLVTEVYVGATLGFVICLTLGVGFLALASLARGLFRCDNLLIFDGCIMMLATVVMTFLALNFYKMIHTKEAHELKMRKQVRQTIEAAQEGEDGEEAAWGKKHAFFVLSFTTGLREGMESIIFLVGVISDFKDPSYISSLPLPIITALVLSRLVGCIFFQGTKRMRVDHFMRFCSIFLLFIAAGFFTSSMHKWQELGLFGTWSPRAERPWHNQLVYDVADCCNDKTNRFWILMRALLGWQDKPTPTEFFAYVFYWIVTVTVGVFIVRRAKRTIQRRLTVLRESATEKAADAETSSVMPQQGNVAEVEPEAQQATSTADTGGDQGGDQGKDMGCGPQIR